ncbi:MAG TPA: peptidoglycan DD-metalloendopeptidase family protein [Candidatus Limnocylindria bacterium]
MLLAAVALLVATSAPSLADPGSPPDVSALERAVAEARANVQRYQEAAKQYQSAVNAATARIAELSNQAADAQDAADALSLEIQVTEEQLALVAYQIDETQSLVDSLTTQAAAEQQQLVKAETTYSSDLRMTYRFAQQSPLEMLLSSSSLTDFANRVQAMILVARADKQLVGQINTLKAATAADKADADLHAKEIVGLKQQIQEQQKVLEKQRADYQAAVSVAVASIGEQSTLRSQAASDKANADAAARSAQNQYEQLATELALRTGLGIFQGKLFLWPVNGVLTQGFGPTRFTGEPPAWYGGVYYPHFHNGIDIAAPMYTPIRAPAAGQVTTVGKPYASYGDYAEVVIIAHGSNFSTLYGHLDDSVRPPTVRAGQRVNAGDIIGYIGMTGFTTGPHLHFMTISGGIAVNPLAYLPPR